jgi:hypothetical protein
MPSSPAERERPALPVQGGDRQAPPGRRGVRLRPEPYLEQLRIPALWLDGTADREVTGDQSIALLNTVKAPGGGGFVAYAGRYSFHGDRVVHRASRRAVAVPNWVENDQERSVDLAGDRLTLCASPLLVVG